MLETRRESLEAYGLAGIGAARGVLEIAKGNNINVNTTDNNSANLGWAALGAGVLIWDMKAKETLSEGVDRALESHPLTTYATVGVVAAHLLNMIPEKVDPIHQAAKRLRTKFQQ